MTTHVVKVLGLSKSIFFSTEVSYDLNEVLSLYYPPGFHMHCKIMSPTKFLTFDNNYVTSMWKNNNNSRLIQIFN